MLAILSMIWHQISYIVQLVLAVLVLGYPFPKRPHLAGRMVLSLAALIGISWGLFTALDLGLPFVLVVLDLAAFYFVLIPFVHVVLDLGWRQSSIIALFAVALQHVAFDLYRVYVLLALPTFTYILVYVAIYLVGSRMFARRLKESISYAGGARDAISTIPIAAVIFLFSVLEMSGPDRFTAESGLRILYRLLDAICCIYVPWANLSMWEERRLQAELAGVRQINEMQKEQYEVKQEMIDQINRKCHDLRHQIQSLRYASREQLGSSISSLEKDVMIYDTSVDTGNKALDLILMDKGMYCQEHGITWTTLIDGRALSFIKDEDLYAIFGNALDNAIEAAQNVHDPARRMVSLRMSAKERMTLVQVQNYYDGKIKFQDGLPVTTHSDKKDHGFGMKSIRYTVEQYNGMISVFARDGIFTLQIMFTRPLQNETGSQQ